MNKRGIKIKASKKAQATLFIIMGITILILFGLLFYTKGLTQEDLDTNINQQVAFEQNVESFSSYVESCLKQHSEAAIALYNQYMNSNEGTEITAPVEEFIKDYLKIKGVDCFDNSIIPSLDVEVEFPLTIEIVETEGSFHIEVAINTKFTQKKFNKRVNIYSFTVSKSADYASETEEIELETEAFNLMPLAQPVDQEPYVKGEVIVKYAYIPADSNSYNELLDLLPVFYREPVYDNSFIDPDKFDEGLRKYISRLFLDEILVFDESEISFEELYDILIEFDFIEDIVRNKKSYSEHFMPLRFMHQRMKGILSISHDDRFYRFQWYLKNVGQFAGTPGSDISIEQAWNITEGSQDVIISVIDEGIFPTKDIVSNILYDKSYNFVGENNDIYPNSPYEYHGTHVASVIASKKNNRIGIAGICPECKIINMRVFDAGEGVDSQTLLNAVLKSVENGADIISMSLGSTYYSSYEEEIFSTLAENGILFVSAAGNDGLDIKNYPAAYNGVISVGATDNNDKIALFSNYGSWVDIFAPGDKILSACGIRTYCFSSGTSMSTPIVSGVIGLMHSIDPSLNEEQVTKLLRENSDNNYRVNAASILQQIHKI